MKKAKVLSTGDVRERLRARYQSPAWVFLEEVRNKTGFSHGGKERYADALALSCYPSRGIELHGFEIKVSRGDFKRELADPTKAQAFSRYCARWYLVVGRADIASEDEVPAQWGLMVPHGTGLRIKRPAPALKPEPWPPNLVASMIRCAHEARPSKAEVKKAREEGALDGKRLQSWQGESDKKELAALREKVDLFNEHSGVELTRHTWEGKVKDQAALFKQLCDMDVEQYRRTATTLTDRLQAVVDKAREALT